MNELCRRLVTFLTLCFALPLTSSGQERIVPEWQCNYVNEKPADDDIYGFASDKEAEDAIGRIVKHTGLVQNFVIRAANVPNAAAVIQNQRRLVLYNQQFIMRVKDTVKTDWGALSIMAHEIGHHLQGHTIQAGGSRPEIELEADRYSGFILRRLGSTLEEAQAAMNAIGSVQGSSTHPPKSARLAAIANGWVEAGELTPPKSGPPGKTPQPQSPEPSPTQTTKPQPPSVPSPTPGTPTYVARCVFAGDPTSYYVTSSDDIIGVNAFGQAVVVGKRIPPTVAGFAWMYSTAYVTYGVDAQGRIWNRYPNGAPFQVGYVTNP